MMGWEETSKIYEFYLEHIKHENALLIARITWFFAAEGFLITAIVGLFAVGGTARPEQEYSFKNGIYYFSVISSFLGAIISAQSTLGLFAAWFAMRDYDRRWRDISKSLSIDRQFAATLPPLMGGGSEFTSFLGFLPAVVAPILLGLAWSIALFLLVFFGMFGARPLYARRSDRAKKEPNTNRPVL